MKVKLKSFFLGFIIATVLFTFLNVSAAGVGTTITVMLNNINIAINGIVIGIAGSDYTLANGDKVPYSIIYKGTTYLPMRKVSELLNKDIAWDDKTMTASINEKKLPATQMPIPSPISAAKPMPMLDSSNYGQFYTASDGLDVKIDKVEINETTMKSYFITYTMKNNANSNIYVGTFKYYSESGLREHYGNFGYLKPGESVTRYEPTNYPRDTKVDYVEYCPYKENQTLGDNSYFTETLKWKIE